MKKIIVILICLLNIQVFSQNKNAKASLEVDGVCKMCKARIEKASIKTKGVKSAIWDVETHELKLIFDERKTTLEHIQKNVVAAGHDTENMKATDEAYNSLHHCCRYREEKVIEDHKD
jgi:copper chaperone CopZ